MIKTSLIIGGEILCAQV